MDDTTSFTACGETVKSVQQNKRLSLYSRIEEFEKRLNASDEFFVMNVKSAKIAENKMKSIKMGISDKLISLNEKTKIIDNMISNISSKDLNSYVISQISAMEKAGSQKETTIASEFRQNNVKFQNLLKNLSNELKNSNGDSSDTFENVENLFFRIKKAQDEQEKIIQKYVSYSKS